VAARVGLGLIGCGGFAGIIGEALKGIEDIEVLHLADQVREKASKLKRTFDFENAKISDDYHHVLEDSRISLVAIATPPYLHENIALSAISNGKAVFCEKPGALSSAAALRIAEVAERQNTKAAVDFVMRQNPLYLVLRELMNEEILGDIERIELENYAHDERLPLTHWFWDKTKSGGIWIEHGVHFFDLVNWLLDEGAPEWIWASGFERDPSRARHEVDEAPLARQPSQLSVEDRVIAVAWYPRDVVASFYHGFRRPERFERTIMRVVGSKGYAAVYGWVPVKLEIETFNDLAGDASLRDRLAQAAEHAMSSLRALQPFEGPQISMIWRSGLTTDVSACMEDEEKRWLRRRGRIRKRTLGRRFRSRNGFVCRDSNTYLTSYELLADRWAVYSGCVRAGLRNLLEGSPPGESYADFRVVARALAAAEAAEKSASTRERVSVSIQIPNHVDRVTDTPNGHTENAGLRGGVGPFGRQKDVGRMEDDGVGSLENLKVALVTSWPTRWCGIATYSLGLSRALKERGLDVRVICHKDDTQRSENDERAIHDERRLEVDGGHGFSCRGKRACNRSIRWRRRLRRDPSSGQPPDEALFISEANADKPPAWRPPPPEPREFLGGAWMDRVHPVIDQRDPGWYLPLEESVKEVKPDVVHIQHEFGLYSLMRREGEFAFLPEDAFSLTVPMFRWRVRRIPVVVTLHSVFSKLTFDEAVYYDAMVSLAHAVIVHEPYQKESLEEMIGRQLENVFVCPHGTLPRRIPEAMRAKMRRKWVPGNEDAVIVGMIGWWEPNKGFERLLDMWPSVVRTGRSAVLVVAGEVRPGSPTGAEYKEKILRIINGSPVRSRIVVEPGRFSEEEFRSVLGSFDFIVLPYTHASQSGNHAHAYGLGIPSVASAIEGLKSSIEASGGGLLAEDDRELKECVLTMISSEKLRRELSEKAWAYATDVISWPRVAQKHAEVYRFAIEGAKDDSLYRKYLGERVHV
jgi:predicted dehydrogenase/glycosyltransferase involved in cell wall biosynthesis